MLLCFFIVRRRVVVPPRLGPGFSSLQSNLHDSLKTHFIVHHTSCNQAQFPKWPRESQPFFSCRKKTLIRTHNASMAALKHNVKGWKWKSAVCTECGGWRWQYYHHLNATSSETTLPQKLKVGCQTWCPSLRTWMKKNSVIESISQ